MTKRSAKQGMAPGNGSPGHLNPETWVSEHGDALFRYALARVGSRETATELVQETFLAALASLGSFQGRSQEQTWLVGILKHKLLDHYRRLARTDPTEEADIEFLAQEERADFQAMQYRWRTDPQALVQDTQLKKVFLDCLAALPERLRAPFALREVEGLTAPEICKELGITATNLWVRLHRARLRLRHCLEARWFLDRGEAAALGAQRAPHVRTDASGRDDGRRE